ncbi:MAG: hypothetical protein MZU95_07090 [Desulfomicrobium escambiense]|nr:hypothetical protein [Desulfomicrobium escambiense]
MILGMTGFAERNFASPTLRLKIGIKTLNHRYFDWSYKGALLGEAESRIRALCQKRIRRGRIEVFVDLVSLSPESWNFTLNEGLLEKIMVSLDRVSRRTGRRFEISLDSLFRVPQLVEVDRKALGPKDAAFLEKCFARTLDDVLALRRREGQETARLLRVHVAAVRRFVRKAEGHVQAPAGPVQGQDQEAPGRPQRRRPGPGGQAGRRGLDAGPALRPGRGDRPAQDPPRHVRGLPRAQGRRARRAPARFPGPGAQPRGQHPGLEVPGRPHHPGVPGHQERAREHPPARPEHRVGEGAHDLRRHRAFGLRQVDPHPRGHAAASATSSSRSPTRRAAPRPSEKDGVDYHFVTEKAFARMVRAERFLEHARVHGHLYGTSLAEVARKGRRRDLVLDIDVQGARQVRRRVPGAVHIFIMPPVAAELRRRLVKRREDAPEAVERRLKNARAEVRAWKEFDFVVVNDDLDRRPRPSSRRSSSPPAAGPRSWPRRRQAHPRELQEGPAVSAKTKIALGVSSSIGIYKACEVVRGFQKARRRGPGGHDPERRPPRLAPALQQPRRDEDDRRPLRGAGDAAGSSTSPWPRRSRSCASPRPRPTSSASSPAASPTTSCRRSSWPRGRPCSSPRP